MDTTSAIYGRIIFKYGQYLLRLTGKDICAGLRQLLASPKAPQHADTWQSRIPGRSQVYVTVTYVHAIPGTCPHLMQCQTHHVCRRLAGYTRTLTYGHVDSIGKPTAVQLVYPLLNLV